MPGRTGSFSRHVGVTGCCSDCSCRGGVGVGVAPPSTPSCIASSPGSPSILLRPVRGPRAPAPDPPLVQRGTIGHASSARRRAGAVVEAGPHLVGPVLCGCWAVESTLFGSSGSVPDYVCDSMMMRTHRRGRARLRPPPSDFGIAARRRSACCGFQVRCLKPILGQAIRGGLVRRP